MITVLSLLTVCTAIWNLYCAIRCNKIRRIALKSIDKAKRIIERNGKIEYEVTITKSFLDMNCSDKKLINHVCVPSELTKKTLMN